MRASSLPLPVMLAAGLLASPAWADPTKQQCLDANVKAQNLRRDDRLAAAREQLHVCASASCPTLVRDDCAKRIDELESAQPTIVFAAKDGAGNDVVAVKLTMDGKTLADRLTGAPLAVDPGEHTFVFETAGQSPLTKIFVLREHEQGRREAVVLGSPGALAPASAKPAATPAAPPSPAQPSSAPSGANPRKVLGIVAGSLGVVGLGVGGAFGLVAMSKKSDAQGVCPGLCADRSGANKWTDAMTAGNVSTVAFVAGGVLVAAGAVLFLTAPSSNAGEGASVGLRVGPGSLQVAGWW